MLHLRLIPYVREYQHAARWTWEKDTFPLFVIQGGRCHGGNSSRERGCGVNVGGRRPYRSSWSCHGNRGDAQEKPFSWPCPPLPPEGSEPRSRGSVHPQTQISGVEGAAIRKKELPHTLTW